MAVHVVKEAQRCLQCKKPMCVQGCPVKTPIPQMIQLFLEGKSAEAGETLFENNPLSVICSLVCDHDRQCEGHCVQARKGTPIQWSDIEHYISDAYLSSMEVESVPKNHVKAAIIGSGPAGLTIALILARRGYDVTIFEVRDKIGGILRYGIPDFRLPKTILDRYQVLLKELGVKIRPNTTIGGPITVDVLLRDGYKSIFIGTGVWRPNSPGLKGESLGNVFYAINYLVDPDGYDLGNSVAIIGAGNAAIDVARTAVRHGSRDVTLYVRRNEAAASQREIEYAIADGVKFRYGMRAQEITDDGPIFRHAEFDENGEITSLGEAELCKADSTIIAVGQGPRSRIVNTTTGIETNEKGLVQIDEQGQTTHEAVFAGGDVTRGARTVVEAVAYSKNVADAMDRYMQQFIGLE